MPGFPLGEPCVSGTAAVGRWEKHEVGVGRGRVALCTDAFCEEEEPLLGCGKGTCWAVQRAGSVTKQLREVKKNGN